jgi:hypothetical protein
MINQGRCFSPGEQLPGGGHCLLVLDHANAIEVGAARLAHMTGWPVSQVRLWMGGKNIPDLETAVENALREEGLL